MTRLVSMSLYGNASMYSLGAVANAKLLPEIYPGWKMRIYCDRTMDTRELESLGCEIKKMSASRQHSGMFWRFFPAWEKGIERVIFRDADSRFNVRESAAVKAWENSGKIAHCMHDHKHHRGLPISGGMWGIKAGYLFDYLLKEIVDMSNHPQKRVIDMRYLAKNIHPLIEKSLLRHSSVKLKWPNCRFPKHPEFNGFVGQQHDSNGESFWPKVGR